MTESLWILCLARWWWSCRTWVKLCRRSFLNSVSKLFILEKNFCLILDLIFVIWIWSKFKSLARKRILCTHFFHWPKYFAAGNIESMYGIKWKHWGDEYVTNVMYAHQSFHQNALSVPCLTIKNISPVIMLMMSMINEEQWRSGWVWEEWEIRRRGNIPFPFWWLPPDLPLSEQGVT